MITWRLLDPGLRADWGSWLVRAPFAPVFQAWGWGEFKQAAGWVPARFVAFDTNNEAVGLAQVLVRHLPGGMRFVWAPGGPIGIPESSALPELMANFHADVGHALGQSYVRCNLMVRRNQDDAEALGRVMARPKFFLNSGYSILLDLSGDQAAWIKSIAAKHRYYVRKSQAAALEWRYGDSDDILRALADMSVRMARDKGLRPQGFNFEKLSELRLHLPRAFRGLVGYLGGEAVTGCMVLRQGLGVFYFAAATVGRGRELSAAYAMVAELRTRLREEGVMQLDFGGINPRSKTAQGVDHFKRGFHGEVVEYLGEWESGGWVARALGNLAVAAKRA